MYTAIVGISESPHLADPEREAAHELIRQLRELGYEISKRP